MYQDRGKVSADPKEMALTIVCGVERDLNKFIEYLKGKGEKKVLRVFDL
jgi:hypothetical protein